MGRAIVEACLPWAALLAASIAVAWLLIRLGGFKICFRRLRHLHRDQQGSAQSFSFVMTLPLLMMVMAFILQVSQLMIATIVVHYAAYATARSAVVWIPAATHWPEGANCISSFYVDPEEPDQAIPILDPEDPNYGPAEGGVTYVIEPGSPKYDKIASAAVLACMPMAPSRDVGLELPPGGLLAADIIERAYGAMDPDSDNNLKVPVRLRNKLAYAMHHTQVEIRFYHKNSEPPLRIHYPPEDPHWYEYNEIGWQDPITVTVHHNLALLPGPGRLLAKPAVGPDGAPDEVSQHVELKNRVYTYPLSASATMGNEGEVPVVHYGYPIY